MKTNKNKNKKTGYIGKLVLKIPWKNLKNDPIFVEIDQIIALAVPKLQREYNQKEEEEEQYKKKLDKLKELDEEKAKKHSGNNFFPTN